MHSLWGFASTVAISIRFNSPPESVASTSLSKYSLAHSPTPFKISQHLFSGISYPAARESSLFTVMPLNLGGC